MTTMFEPEPYETRPMQTMAIQVTPENLIDVVKWTNSSRFKVEYDVNSVPVSFALAEVDGAPHRSVGGKFGAWAVRDHEVILGDDGKETPGDVVHYVVNEEDFEERFRKGWS